MSIPTRGELRDFLLSRFPAALVDEHLASFPPAYFDGFGPEELARHLSHAASLNDDRPVKLHAERLADSPTRWRVEVAGYDAFQFLSTACMLMAVHGLAIHQARVFTSEPPAPVHAVEGGRRSRGFHPFRPRRIFTDDEGSPSSRMMKPRSSPPRRLLLDVFVVEPIDGQQGDPNWSALEAELLELTQLLRHGEHEKAQNRLIHRFVLRLEHLAPEPADRALQPIEVEIDPSGSAEATRVHVLARDSFGFLSLTAGALSLCGIRIVQADIHTTGDGLVDDLLWVTDRAGRKIDDEKKIRSLRSTLILIEHFSSRLHRASDPQSALVHFSRFAAETMARPDWDAEFAALDRPEVLDALVQVLGESRFLWEDYLLAQPENILPLLNDPSGWKKRRGKELLASDLAAELLAAPPGPARARALQLFRDREIFRTDIRTILGLTGGLEGFSAELSDVAEVITPAALAMAVEELGPDAPLQSNGTPVSFSLFSLGKFGGRELGFASDLELMLVYDDRDVAHPGAWKGAAEYFDRLVGSFRSIMEARQGATFDLDFRLRPYGKSGAPAVAHSLFTSYFAPEGPAWAYERQALIKLRLVAGDEALGREIESLRDRYVFLGTWPDPDERRRLREMQVRQLTRPGKINAKLSPGALVEVEYTVQTLQIRYGADEPAVRSPNTLQALAALESLGHLSAEQARILREGYQFFRALVSALRVVHGHAKDLVVPDPESDDYLLLARRLRRSLPVRFVDRVARDLRGLIASQLEAVKSVSDAIDLRARKELGLPPVG